MHHTERHSHEEQTFSADIDHMQHLLGDIRQLQEEAQRMAQQSAVPNCHTLFNDVSVVTQALMTMTQNCIDECQRMQRTGVVEEFIQVGHRLNRAA